MHLMTEHYQPNSQFARCYIVKDSESGEAFVVDPGLYTPKLDKILKSMNIKKLRYILITHSHFDHVLGVGTLKRKFGGEVIVHEKDATTFKTQDRSLKAYGGFLFPLFKFDTKVAGGEKLKFGDGEIEIIHTPGHTKGGVCFKTADLLFTGDTLFHMRTGWTHLPGGSKQEMKESMKTLWNIQGDYKVYPGHEELTTLQWEKDNSPCFKNI